MKNMETDKIQKVKGDTRWEVGKGQNLPIRSNESSNTGNCI